MIGTTQFRSRTEISFRGNLDTVQFSDIETCEVCASLKRKKKKKRKKNRRWWYDNLVRVSNEMKFNFVKALTQFGKECAKDGRKFEVGRRVVDRRACKCNERGSGATHAAARSGAPRHGVTTHRFDLYNSGPRWWSLVVRGVAWYARTPDFAAPLFLFVTRPRFGWTVNWFWPIASSTLENLANEWYIRGDCWILGFVLGSVNNYSYLWICFEWLVG